MQQFKEVVSAITGHAPEPEPAPRRKRKEEGAGGGFSLAATLILRRIDPLPSPVYAAIAFLSDTLDWMNPWHSDASNDNLMDDEVHYTEQNDLSLHL